MTHHIYRKPDFLSSLLSSKPNYYQSIMNIARLPTNLAIYKNETTTWTRGKIFVKTTHDRTGTNATLFFHTADLANTKIKIGANHYTNGFKITLSIIVRDKIKLNSWFNLDDDVVECNSSFETEDEYRDTMNSIMPGDKLDNVWKQFENDEWSPREDEDTEDLFWGQKKELYDAISFLSKQISPKLKKAKIENADIVIGSQKKDIVDIGSSVQSTLLHFKCISGGMLTCRVYSDAINYFGKSLKIPAEVISHGESQRGWTTQTGNDPSPFNYANINFLRSKTSWDICQYKLTDGAELTVAHLSQASRPTVNNTYHSKQIFYMKIAEQVVAIGDISEDCTFVPAKIPFEYRARDAFEILTDRIVKDIRKTELLFPRLEISNATDEERAEALRQEEAQIKVDEIISEMKNTSI